MKKMLIMLFLMSASILQAQEYNGHLRYGTCEQDARYVQQLTPSLQRGIDALRGLPTPSSTPPAEEDVSLRSSRHTTPPAITQQQNTDDENEISCCCCLWLVLKSFRGFHYFQQPYIDNTTFSDAYPDAFSCVSTPKQ